MALPSEVLELRLVHQISVPFLVALKTFAWVLKHLGLKQQ